MSKDIRDIFFYCSYCLDPIYENEPYAVNHEGNKFHLECQKLIDNTRDSFELVKENE